MFLGHKHSGSQFELHTHSRPIVVNINRKPNCSSQLACVASVSVWFRGKEIPRKETFGFDRARNETRATFLAVFDSRSSFFSPKPYRNACYAGYKSTDVFHINIQDQLAIKYNTFSFNVISHISSATSSFSAKMIEHIHYKSEMDYNNSICNLPLKG